MTDSIYYKAEFYKLMSILNTQRRKYSEQYVSNGCNLISLNLESDKLREEQHFLTTNFYRYIDLDYRKTCKDLYDYFNEWRCCNMRSRKFGFPHEDLQQAKNLEAKELVNNAGLITPIIEHINNGFISKYTAKNMKRILTVELVNKYSMNKDRQQVCPYYMKKDRQSNFPYNIRYDADFIKEIFTSTIKSEIEYNLGAEYYKSYEKSILDWYYKLKETEKTTTENTTRMFWSYWLGTYLYLKMNHNLYREAMLEIIQKTGYTLNFRGDIIPTLHRRGKIEVSSNDKLYFRMYETYKEMAQIHITQAETIQELLCRIFPSIKIQEYWTESEIQEPIIEIKEINTIVQETDGVQSQSLHAKKHITQEVQRAEDIERILTLKQAQDAQEVQRAEDIERILTLKQAQDAQDAQDPQN